MRAIVNGKLVELPNGATLIARSWASALIYLADLESAEAQLR